jgi:hypothetical protein
MFMNSLLSRDPAGYASTALAHEGGSYRLR